MIFIEKFSIFRKKFFIFISFFILCCLCYYCSINVKRQSELSGFCPDTSSLVLLKIIYSLDGSRKTQGFIVLL